MTPTDPIPKPKGRTVVPATLRDRLAEADGLWALIFVAVFFLLCVLQFRLAPPPQLAAGELSPSDIRSPVDVEIVDQQRTEEKRTEAFDRQPPLFDTVSGARERTLERIRNGFFLAREVSRVDSEPAKPAEEAENQPESSPDISEPKKLSLEEWASAIQAQPGKGNLNAEEARVLAEEGFSEALEILALQEVKALVQGRVTISRAGLHPDEKILVRRQVGQDTTESSQPSETVKTLEEVLTGLEMKLIGEYDLPQPLVSALKSWLSADLEPSLIFNPQETMRRREEARDAVAPLVTVLRRGQLIVAKDDRLTEDQSRILSQLPALADYESWYTLSGAALGLALILLFFCYRAMAWHRWRRSLDHNPFTLAMGVSILQILLCGLFFWLGTLVAGTYPDILLSEGKTVMFLLPVAFGSMLLVLLSDRQVALTQAIFMVPLITLFVKGDATFLIFCLVSSLAGIYFVLRYRHYSVQFVSGLATGVAGGLSLVALHLSESGLQMDSGLLVREGMVLIGGVILVPVMLVAAVPLFEGLFGVLTDARLNALSSLNHPLLQQLAMNAPGTYNHSLTMSSMCEQAAKEIGANTLLVKIGCFYHDIGKSLNPEYFIENQVPGRNPHEKLDPQVSVKIILNHVSEGIDLGIKHGLPRQIIDLIPQHHGSRVLRYFYEKARTQAEDPEQIDPEDFRYPGPMPQSKEGAILMLADGIEAGSRVLKDATEQTLEVMIREISGKVILEDQLIQCSLTFEELEKVLMSFLKTLKGIKGRRISYPGFAFDKTNQDETDSDQGKVKADSPELPEDSQDTKDENPGNDEQDG